MTSQFPLLARLLAQNAQWASGVKRADPSFFVEAAKGQFPKVFWLGCSDSRVPESVKMSCKPGEIFTSRNIGNQFHLDDDSAQSVLSYAVEVLGVEHVIVAGHTNCGGVATAYDIACENFMQNRMGIKITPQAETPLSRWLSPLVKMATDLRLPPAPPEEALPILLKESVKRQVVNVCSSGVKAKGYPVYVHGWIYELESGLLRDLKISRPL